MGSIPSFSIVWKGFCRILWFVKPLLDAAAKSLQSSPTLQPHRWQPTRLLCPQDSLGKNTGVGCHFLLCLLDKPTKLSRPKVFWASLVAQRVKHLPAMQETWVQSLVWEDPLEMEMAMHSSTLTGKMPWMEETGRLSMGSQRVLHDWATSLYLNSQIGKLNLNFCFRGSLMLSW